MPSRIKTSTLEEEKEKETIEVCAPCGGMCESECSKIVDF
jgi:hypothetical protein